MKKYLLRIKIEDEMLIDTCEARDRNLAVSKFIYRNSTQLAPYDGPWIDKHISLITEVEDEKMP